jgi:Domain of unknown function (DUF2017)
VFFPRQIRREGDRVRLNLDGHEQALLRELLDQLEPLLADPDDPALRRLFPPAYSEEENDQQYRSLVRDQLVNGRAKALASMRDTLASETIDVEQADEWLRALNDLRLVLGTRLDVSEEIDYERIDLDEPRGRELAIYGYLAWLQEQLVDALQPASGR